MSVSTTQLNLRALSALVVWQVFANKQSLNVAFPNYTDKLSNKDRALAKELCYGTLRQYFLLNELTKELLLNPIKPKEQLIQSLLLVGLYQILFTRIPAYAIVSETVTAAKQFDKFWAKGLLNKVLRRMIEEKDSLLEKAQQSLLGKYVHPEWLIKAVESDYPDLWQQILLANNQNAPMFIRTNKQKIDRDEYLELLHEKEIGATASEFLPQAIQLTTPLAVPKLPGFNEGFCSVQDVAGQWIPQLLDINSQHRILDACAAPGSKTCHILELYPDIQYFTAMDIDAARLALLKENITRLELNHENLHLILADAIHSQQWWDGVLFDRILIDAPCSGTGVIRRHPDIKLLRTEEDIENLAQRQHLLLKSLWPLLATGGKLLYTTCSILNRENNQVIQSFLSEHKDAKAIPLHIPDATIASKFGNQRIPEINGGDGFYYSLLTKI